MRSEPFWLPRIEVIEINRAAVALSGEPFVLLRPELLESALARPIHFFAYGQSDTLTLALCLLFGIARNHPFEQGNKRTGFTAASMFLNLNGYVLTVADTEFLGECVNSVLRGKMTEEGFAATLRPFVAETPEILEIVKRPTGQ